MLPGMMMGCGVSTFVNTETPVFSPSELFSAGEEGVWYDPSDLSTMWTDTAGTVQVTSNGDVVRRIDDKSGNGVNLTQSGSGIVYRTSGGLHWLEHTASYLVGSGTKSKLTFAHRDGFSGCYGVQFGVVSSPDTKYQLYTTSFGSGQIGIDGTYDDRPEHGRNNEWWASIMKGSQGNFVVNNNGDPADFLQANQPLVLAEIYDTDASVVDRHKARLNGGAEQKYNIADSAASSSPPYAEFRLGARSDGSFPLTGRVYSFVIVEGQIGATDIDDLESWVAGKTGVILST